MADNLRAQTRVIMWKEIAELKSKGAILFGLVILLSVWMLNVGFIGSRLQTGLGPYVMKIFVDAALTHQALSMCMVATFVFLGTSFTRERYTGTLEFVLTSHLSVHAYWLGKCLFVFILGYAFCLFGGTLVVLELNLLLVDGHVLLPSAPAIVFFFTLLPGITLTQCLLIGGFQMLSANAVLARTAYLLVSIAYMMISAVRMNSMAITWKLLIPYAGVLLVLAIGVTIMGNRFDRERIIYAVQ